MKPSVSIQCCSKVKPHFFSKTLNHNNNCNNNQSMGVNSSIEDNDNQRKAGRWEKKKKRHLSVKE